MVAVHNFGAGDIIEVRPAHGGETQLLPFDAATVPEMDVAAGVSLSSFPREPDACP